MRRAVVIATAALALFLARSDAAAGYIEDRLNPFIRWTNTTDYYGYGLSDWDMGTHSEKEDWFEHCASLDIVDTHAYVPGEWVCHDFAVQTCVNFAGYREPIPAEYTDPAWSTPNRFNLPLYYVLVTAPGWAGHAINAILVGYDPLDFDDWYFFEPQNDRRAVPGGWNIPAGSTMRTRIAGDRRNIVSWQIADDLTPTLLDHHDDLVLFRAEFKHNGSPVTYAQLLALTTPVLSSGHTVSGWGTYNAAFTGAAASAIVADDGYMILGDATSFAGFSTEGTVDTQANTVTLRSAGFAALGIQTTLGGGTLIAANGIALGSGDNLVGSGTVDAKIAAQFGSTIRATGDLSAGDSESYAGFTSDGELYTGAHTVTIHDADAGVLGSLTVLGAASAGGTLAAPNGLLIEQGKNLVGRGHVAGNLVNQGSVVGDGTAPAARIVFDEGYVVSGTGSLKKVLFNGTYSPGNSPGLTHLANAAWGPSATVNVEIGGRRAGSEYDRIVLSGESVRLDGTLLVDLIDAFEPRDGDTFQIFDFDALPAGPAGQFHTVDLPPLGQGLAWDAAGLYIDGTLRVAPEPGTLSLAALGALVTLCRRRRRQANAPSIEQQTA